MWARYLQALQTRPIATNTATALCINFMGDMLAQNIEHNTWPPTTSVDINWERTWTVATFGMLSAGPACYWFRWLDHQFPLAAVNKFSSRSLWTLAQKLTVHLGIFAPAVNASFYGWIIMKNRVMNMEDWKVPKEGVLQPTTSLTSTSKFLPQPCQLEQSAKMASSANTITRNNSSSSSLSFWQEWYTKLERDLIETQKNSVKVWGPTQTFNFLVLPAHTRVLFSNCVMVVWTAYLSIMGHKKHEDGDDDGDEDDLPVHQEY